MDFKRLRHNISKFFLGNSVPLSGFWSWSLPGHWNKTDLIDQYTRYVYAVVSAIAEEAAKVTFEVKQGEKPLLTHEFLKLMKMPNPDQSQFQFLELHFTFMKLCGESYWYMAKGIKSGQPKELYLLRPDLMTVAVDKEDPRGRVVGYVLNKLDGKKETFEKEEILHFKMPNPKDPYYGLGTVQASKTYIETEEYASTWTKNSIFNSGRPSGILSIKGVIPQEEFNQIKKQFKDNYSGTQNAGKTMILKGADGMDYQKLGMELGEVALKELKDMTRDDIMVMFRVSKTILGITDDVNRASALEARAVFTRNVIMPELDRFIDHLNAFLIPTWGENLTLGYKEMITKSDADKLNEWDKGCNRWLTINDIRLERGMKPVPGGDEFSRPITNVPIGTDPNQDPNNDPNADPKKKPKKDPNAEEDKPKKGLKKKDLRQQRADIFKQILFDTQIAWERQYKEIIVKEFKTQEKEVLKGNKAVFPEWTFDVVASKGRLVSTLTPLSLELLKEAAKFALDMADDGESELDITEEMRDFVHERITRLAEATNDTTITSIEQTIAEGVSSGESVAKLRDRIREVYDIASKVRAERIARTETLAASNDGALEAYRQSPLVVAKEWSAEADACEFCAGLDGKIVGLEEDFAKVGQDVEGEDGGKYTASYTDIETPPLHPNCRCAILPVAQK